MPFSPTVDAAKAFVAATGRILHAPVATAKPTDATTSLNAAFKEVGYIGEAGVTEAEGQSENKIKAWQDSAVVRKVRTEHDLTYKFDLLEAGNDEVIKLVHGSGTFASHTITGAALTNEALVIEAVDGASIVRIVIPNGQVTEVGERKYVAGEAVVYPVTVTAYPDTSGVKAYKYKGTVS